MVVVSLPIEKTIQLEVSADLIPPPPLSVGNFHPTTSRSGLTTACIHSR